MITGRKLEKVVGRKVDAWAKEHKVLSFVLDYAGWPDRVYLLPNGAHVYIEFKRPGKAPRKLQSVRLGTLVDYKQKAYYCDNAAEAIKILKDSL